MLLCARAIGSAVLSLASLAIHDNTIPVMLFKSANKFLLQSTVVSFYTMDLIDP